MSGSCIFSPGVMPVVALWYRVGFSNAAAGGGGDVVLLRDKLALHHVAINVLYRLLGLRSRLEGGEGEGTNKSEVFGGGNSTNRYNT